MPKIATVSGPPLALCQAVATPQTDCFDTTNQKFIYGGNEIYRPTWQYEYPIVKVATHGLAKISVLRVWLHNVCLHKQQKPLWSPTPVPGTPSCKSDYSASDCPLHPASTEPCAPYNALQWNRGEHLKKLLYTAPPLASHQGDIWPGCQTVIIEISTLFGALEQWLTNQRATSSTVVIIGLERNIITARSRHIKCAQMNQVMGRQCLLLRSGHSKICCFRYLCE